MAVELLNNKTKNETRIILTDVIKDGNVRLIDAMVQVLDHPPASVIINKPGFVAMQRVYMDSFTYSKTLLKRELSDNIKEACGVITTLAKIDVDKHQKSIFHNLVGGHYSYAALSR